MVLSTCISFSSMTICHALKSAPVEIAAAGRLFSPGLNCWGRLPPRVWRRRFAIVVLRSDGVVFRVELPVSEIDFGELLHRMLHDLFVITDVFIENRTDLFVIQVR